MAADERERLESALGRRWCDLREHLDERSRRLWLAAEARSLGYGGVAFVASVTKVARDTIADDFAQMAVDADPDSGEAHAARVEVFRIMERHATSTMSKGVYGWAIAESKAFLDGDDRDEQLRAKTAGRTQWAF